MDDAVFSYDYSDLSRVSIFNEGDSFGTSLQDRDMLPEDRFRKVLRDARAYFPGIIDDRPINEFMTQIYDKLTHPTLRNPIMCILAYQIVGGNVINKDDLKKHYNYVRNAGMNDVNIEDLFRYCKYILAIRYPKRDETK